MHCQSDGGDPASRAELNALRQAGQHLKSVPLKSCLVYASGQPYAERFGAAASKAECAI
ncbi:hypothetical protein [Acinetobacter bouvetii]|uniref:hypothetical protein n=1 Tax=Acinetobacter bouvetii TaxID=202951 RepID=UPI0003698E5E|nr:hypothetical protein [Acinetobacter bouvetii]